MMKKIVGSAICLAASAMLLTGCGNKLDGEYTLCLDDKTEICAITFDAEDEEFTLARKSGDFTIEGDEIDLDFEDGFRLSGTYSYKILDKDAGLIYIEDFSEAYASATMSTIASTFQKAINSAFMDLDFEGEYDLYGQGMISSDESKNVYDGSDDFVQPLYAKLDMYFSDGSNYAYFAEINEGAAMQVFCASSWDSKVVGAYGYTSDASAYAGKTLQEIYDEISKDYN